MGWTKCNSGGKPGIPPGTVLIEAGVISSQELVSAPNGLLITVSANGSTSGASGYKDVILDERLIGKTLRASITYKRTNACFSGQISWVGYFQCNSITINSADFINEVTGTSVKTNDFSVGSSVLRIGATIRRTSNETQHSQNDTCQIEITDLVVM